MNRDDQHDQHNQGSTRTVTLTEDELREYTERAVAAALEQARPSREAVRIHLLQTRDELEHIFSGLWFDRSVQRWDLTAADVRAIERAKDMELMLELRSITTLRTHIRRLHGAIARLEAAQRRHRDRIAAARARNAARDLAQIEKERAEHLAEIAGVKHRTSCQMCQALHMKETAVRIVSEAPPFSTQQILDIKRALGG